MTRGLAHILLLLALGSQAAADSLIAAHTIRSRAVLTAQDVQIVADHLPGALSDPEQAIGMEARVVLYAGRGIRPEDLVAPAIVERNQIVPIVFQNGTLAIVSEGRSLARAAIGERVRVMNLQSRNTVTGLVDAQGRVWVDSAEMKFANMETLR